MKKQQHAGTRRRAAPFPLSDSECQRIAADFDGSTQSADELWRAWRGRFPALKRQTILQAAKRGGFGLLRNHLRWTAAEDMQLRALWCAAPPAEIAGQLRRSSLAIKMRAYRLGLDAPPPRPAHPAARSLPARVENAQSPQFQASLRARVSAQDNLWLSALGWEKEWAGSRS